MKLITNNDYQCVAASFAMVMGTTLEDLFERLGHNGLDKILDAPEPVCYRGFHPQEFADLLLKDGYSMTMIEAHPCMNHGNDIVDHSEFLGEKRFYDSLLLGDGVIFGSVKSGNGHAVAWNANEQKIYDPRGYTFIWNKGQDFTPKQFFLIQQVW